jgi:hypothetical protein
MFVRNKMGQKHSSAQRSSIVKDFAANRKSSGATRKFSLLFTLLFFLPSFFLPAIVHLLAGKKRAGKITGGRNSE